MSRMVYVRVEFPVSVDERDGWDDDDYADEAYSSVETALNAATMLDHDIVEVEVDFYGN